MKSLVRVDLEPGIINLEMILEAAKELAPKGEAGEVYLSQEIDIFSLERLRLDFRRILRVDQLWMLKNLTSLSLSNNIIEKIENLQFLENLKELNLSFNKIEVIENLEGLKKLEVLSLFSNRIVELKNIDNLICLEVFSIGKNLIHDQNCVLYLRKFRGLHSLTLEGNPCAEMENFREYVAAYIPQLIYYEYKKISSAERERGNKQHREELKEIEAVEEDEEKRRKVEKERATWRKFLQKSYIDGLEGDELYQKFFEKDVEGVVIMEIGDKVFEIYEHLKEELQNTSLKLFNLGQEQFKVRIKEKEKFQKMTNENLIKWTAKSRRMTEEMEMNRASLEEMIKKAVSRNAVDSPEKIAEAIKGLMMINKAFHKMLGKAWYDLMENEIYLNEQIEEVNGRYERNMNELIGNFIEAAQGLFGQMRESEMAYFEGLTDKVNRFVNMHISRGTSLPATLPEPLLAILQNKDTITNALGASHDVHLQVIDSTEDSILKRIREWHRDKCADLVETEIRRNRSVVLEIAQLTDFASKEFRTALRNGYSILLEVAKENCSEERPSDEVKMLTAILAKLEEEEDKEAKEEEEEKKKEQEEDEESAIGLEAGDEAEERPKEERKKAAAPGAEEKEAEAADEGAKPPPPLPADLPPFSDRDAPAYTELIVRELWAEDSDYPLVDAPLKHIDKTSPANQQ